MKTKLALITALTISLPVHADYMGGLDGRTADLSAQPQMAIEVNANNLEKDVKWVGARFTYKLSETMMVFGDVAQVTTDSIDDGIDISFKGQSFGGGVILDVPEILQNFNTSLKFSYHMADLPTEQDLQADGQAVTAEVAFKAMSGKLLLSPVDPISESGLTWYASAGYASVDASFSVATATQSATDDLDPLKGFAGGVGIIYPMSFGEVYAGYESIAGDAVTGGGIRFNF